MAIRKPINLQYIRKKDITKSLELSNKLVGMTKEDGSIVYDNFIAVKITIAYFLSNEYQLALDSINSVLDNRMKTQRKDCYSLLLMYEILIYTKLNWNSMAESKLLALIRYLKLYYNKGSFENWCVGFLRKLIKGNESTYKSTIQHAMDTMKDINEEDLSDHILGVGEFKIWFEHELAT